MFSHIFSGLVLSQLADARFDWSLQNGETKLLGNSFGTGLVNATYDYVIVGAGTAGLTIAHVLASRQDLRIAVIDAGNFYETDIGNTSQVPGYGSTYLAFNDLAPNYERVDFDLITEPQKGLNNRRVHYGAGKTFGGSSALNDMIFHRATKGSMDMWASVVGDASYSWKNFLPYLKKSVTFNPPTQNAALRKANISYDAGAFHNSGSPLQVSYPNYRQPFDPYLEKGFQASGLDAIDGVNSGNLEGYAAGIYTIDPKAAVRSSSASSFMQYALQNSSNVKFYSNSMAQKVLFNSNKVATGVEVVTNGGRYILNASKEVIVSAGVFHSPQVLMLSGIGPTDQLKSHGIPVVSALNGVGNNMIDQVFIFTKHETNITTNSGVLTNPKVAAAAVDQYLKQQDGPLTGVSGDIIAFEKFSNRSAFTPTARKELSTLPSDWVEAEYLGLSSGANPDDMPLANNHVFLTSAVFAPFSKGYVNITSASASDPPRINPNSLASDTEAQVGVQALKRMRQFAGASGVQVRETAPGPSVVTDAQILNWIRNNAVNGYHAGCSCRMGKPGDPDAVIDSKARVFGVKSLRVVDASAFAILPPGHPMSTIYALAWKIGEDILSGL